MDAAFISALSALGGSMVGGLTSGLATWLSQRAQAKADLVAHDMYRREDLYKDFIVAASKAYGEALVKSEPQIQDLIALYGMISRMRVLSSSEIIQRADNIMQFTMETYFAPNKTMRELNDVIKSGTGVDQLKAFSEAAREELNARRSLL